MDTRRYFNAAWLVFAFALNFPAATIATGQEKVTTTTGQTFVGVVSVTTNADGTATYITAPAQQDQEPLGAGFVIQYEAGTPSPIDFHGEGHIMYAEETSSHRPLALTVKTEDGRCWMFKTDIYGGRVPTGCEAIADIGGLAHFWWSSSAKEFPRTHEEFVQQREKIVAALQGAVIPAQSCSCGGGCGSSGCSCSGQGGCGCSVTCKANKDACCSGCSSCVCIPPCDLPAQALLGGGTTRVFTVVGKGPCIKAAPSK